MKRDSLAILVVAALTTTASASLDPIITELFPNQNSPQAGSFYRQYIELFNPTSADVSLDNVYKICTRNEANCFDLYGTILSHSYFFICRNETSDFTTIHADALACNQAINFELNSYGNHVMLTKNGVAIDEVSYASGTGQNAGKVYRRSYSKEAWDWSTEITPGFGSLPFPSRGPASQTTHQMVKRILQNTPTMRPTMRPTTMRPTMRPTTMRPTMRPTTMRPTMRPTTKLPTKAPSTKAPSKTPTKQPTNMPTNAPIKPPTKAPTKAPVKLPTKAPVKLPTKAPTKAPIKPPTKAPTKAPITKSPTKAPTKAPITKSPTKAPPFSLSLLSNWDFEGSSLDPWTSNGGAAVQRVSDGGSMVATVTGRLWGTWQGIGQAVPVDTFQIGEAYHVSVRARLLNIDNTVIDHLRLTLQITTGGQTTWQSMASTNELTNQWSTFEDDYGPFNVAGTITSLRVFAEGAMVGRDFAIDDVMITKYEAPTSAPTNSPELVDANMNTEYVTIPQPPAASLTVNTARIGCPHSSGSLVNWTSLYPNLSHGQDLVLQANTNILVSQSIPTKLGKVTIPATSAVIFGENINGITMDVDGMDVKGSLIAGSESCRYLTKLTITLHGSRPSNNTNPTDPATKGISVTGTLSLHGKRFYRTWTRLAKRAVPGEPFLYLQDEVNWEPGQEIVLVTTAMRDTRDWHENEVYVIASIETINLPAPEVKAVVYLETAIANVHIARQEYQAEVGLLTRTIKIQGAELDSKPTDTTPSSCQVVDHNNYAKTIFGYNQVSCPNTYLTGYGGHVIMHGGGKGFVEGVELYRMGQTNFLGRYPMHFHVLGDSCVGCYFRDSSIHESYYRCISIHGTNNLLVSENVGYDITGYCYYLEDGVEENNTLSYNLAAHIHFIGNPAIGGPQQINVVKQSGNLILPADVTASGFYITNVRNVIRGNVASGGWAGFAFPALNTPLGPHRNLTNYSPRKLVALEIDGNTAHSTAYFWGSAAAFYFGGALYYDSIGNLEYNAGRPFTDSQNRYPCIMNPETGDCDDSQNLITNSKVYQVPNVGIGSWSGKMDVVRYECHDIGLALEALESGFWIDQMKVTCRTGEKLKLPIQRAYEVRGNGFVWYDTGQDHIITDSTFKNCGYRSSQYAQYESSPTRGCDGNPNSGCHSYSSVFGFLTHSDQFNPEIMQATKSIQMYEVGRRFRYSNTNIESVSGRTQNWLDTDGTASGLNEPTLMGSGLQSAGSWWRVDNDVVNDVQGPLAFIQKNNGPARGLAHIRVTWDDTLHATVGTGDCVNGRDPGVAPFCLPHGYIRHVGPKFAADDGLPVTAQPEIVGLAGGYGWVLTLDEGAPKQVKITEIEVDVDTPLLLSIQYPIGVSVTIKAHAVHWCYEACNNSCEETFTEVGTIDEVRNSIGNVYHHDALTGVVTLRVIMFPELSTGFPYWKLFDFNDILPIYDGGYALKRFERKGIRLPKAGYSESHISIVANCTAGGTNNAYCVEAVTGSTASLHDVCSTPLFHQMSYDRCCSTTDASNCEYPYSMTPPPTLAPTPAPTRDQTEVLENGGFDGFVYCPWDVSWGVQGLVETSNVLNGTSAVKITGRTASWQGIGQQVFGRLKLDVGYQFKGAIYIQNNITNNPAQVKIQAKYDRSTGSCSQEYSYHTVFASSNLPGSSWFAMSSQFTLSSASLVSGCTLTGLRFYVESWNALYNFVLDEFSVKSVASNIFG